MAALQTALPVQMMHMYPCDDHVVSYLSNADSEALQ